MPTSECYFMPGISKILGITMNNTAMNKTDTVPIPKKLAF